MRLGFVGGWGHHYLRGCIGDGDAVAYAGDGHDNAAARARCDSVAGARWYDDVSQLLSEFKPDVVNVGCVYAHNAEVIARCIERGVAVVSDKPIAATWAQLDRLRALCDAHPRQRLITEMDWRGRPCLRAAQQAVQRGDIGQVVLLTAQKSYRFGERPAWYARRADYGGTIGWVASHAIDAMIFASSLRPVRAFGTQGNIARSAFGEMEDHIVSVFEFENGAKGVCHADFLRPVAAATHGDDRLRIAGSAGVVEIRSGRCLLTTDTAAERDITDTQPPIESHIALLDAALRDHEAFYSTAHSLDLAAVLLVARDAADGQRVCDMPAVDWSVS